MQTMTNNVVTSESELQSIYDQLILHASGQRNTHQFACMLASWRVGQGSMPARLGLVADEFTALLETYFPGADFPMGETEQDDNSADRFDEQDELFTLLVTHRADMNPDTVWMARIVTAGCMGGNHLWQDLGLWSRQELSDLMEKSFPELAQKNDKNMKWKKFLYKQLCIQEGIYTCRSPSCEVCVDYQVCFGPE